MVINTKELNIAMTLGYIKEAEKFYYILLHIYIASFRIMERADVENFENNHRKNLCRGFGSNHILIGHKS